MKKPVSALICAVFTLCAASPLYAKTAAHSTAKSAAKVAKIAHRSSDSTSPYLQCVVFARQFTGMQIFGDAWTWWEKATGKYDEGHAPKPGAVLVFRPQGKMRLGHVAVVSQIITDRYIQVTHANWSPVNGHRGRVETNVNVMDVSENGDWSKVKVWYGPLNDLGTTVYTTYGFIYQSDPQARVLIAQSDQDTAAEAPAAGPPASPVTQVAMADTAPAELPADLKAALTPGNSQGFLSARPVQVSARVEGASASQIVAQLNTPPAKPQAVVAARSQTLGRP